jgi:hypothetical protein
MIALNIRFSKPISRAYVLKCKNDAHANIKIEISFQNSFQID